MLKAVRFDENNHKNILEFIENYYDNKGKLNESEGIRYLMQLGLDSINNCAPSTTFDSMKTELLEEFLKIINSQNINLLDKLDKIQPVYIQNSQIEKIIDKTLDKIPDKIKSKKVNIPGNANALLNNLLDNLNK